MALVTFVHLSIRNFTSWKKLDLPLESRGSVCLIGQNGSGKSSIFKALFWCLYGILPDPVKADEIRGSKKPTCVTLQMRKGKHLYTLTRHRAHPLLKNKLEFSGYGIPKTDEDSLLKDVQALVNYFIGATPETFLTTTLFAQRNFHVFHSLSDTGKKEWLESNTYGSLFSDCESITRENFRYLERQVDYDEGKLVGLRESLSVVKESEEERKEKLTKAIRKLEHSNVIKRKHMRDLNEELEKTSKTAKTYKEVDDDFDDKTSLLDTATYAYNKLKNSPNTCSLCGSVMDERKRQKELTVLRIELDIARSSYYEADLLHKSYQEAMNIRKGLYDGIASYSRVIKDNEREIKRLTDELKDLEQVSDLQKNIEDLEKILKTQQLKLAYYKFWVHGFGFQGLRTYALRTASGYLLERMRYYLGKLVGVRFDVDLEFINNRIVLSFANRSYGSLSGGERQAVDLSTGFALRDVAERYNKCRFNIMILDEPFENLDDVLTTKAQSLLLESERDSIFFITHRLTDVRFTKTLYVDKSTGNSQLSIVK